MNNKAHLRPNDYDRNGDIIPMSWKEDKGGLISRATVWEALCLDKYGEGKMMSANIVKTVIANIPVVEEKPQGEWVEGYHDGFTTHDCSICGHSKESTHLQYNFCPNCGADMRGGGAE